MVTILFVLGHIKIPEKSRRSRVCLFVYVTKLQCSIFLQLHTATLSSDDKVV